MTYEQLIERRDNLRRQCEAAEEEGSPFLGVLEHQWFNAACATRHAVSYEVPLAGTTLEFSPTGILISGHLRLDGLKLLGELTDAH
jgi:hypothetical protein